MTKITSRYILSEAQRRYSAAKPQTIVEDHIGGIIGKMIIDNFPIIARPYRADTEFELSVFVYSEEEIKKILLLLPRADTADGCQAIHDILTKNRNEPPLSIKN